MHVGFILVTLACPCPVFTIVIGIYTPSPLGRLPFCTLTKPVNMDPLGSRPLLTLQQASTRC